MWLQVGAQTETELKEKKLRVEDALNATKVRPKAVPQHRPVVLSAVAFLSAEPANSCHMPCLCTPSAASTTAANAPISCRVLIPNVIIFAGFRFLEDTWGSNTAAAWPYALPAAAAAESLAVQM